MRHHAVIMRSFFELSYLWETNVGNRRVVNGRTRHDRMQWSWRMSHYDVIIENDWWRICFLLFCFSSTLQPIFCFFILLIMLLFYLLLFTFLLLLFSYALYSSHLISALLLVPLFASLLYFFLFLSSFSCFFLLLLLVTCSRRRWWRCRRGRGSRRRWVSRRRKVKVVGWLMRSNTLRVRKESTKIKVKPNFTFFKTTFCYSFWILLFFFYFFFLNFFFT